MKGKVGKREKRRNKRLGRDKRCEGDRAGKGRKRE